MKFQFQFVILIGLLCCSMTIASVTSAQSTGTQTFSVVVPANVSVIAPNSQSIIHDETDNPQAFPPQAWIVRGNILGGINVTLTADSPFVHKTDATSRRDLQLDLAIGIVHGPAAWTVNVPTDATDYSAGKTQAVVTASSDGVGRANVELTVSFLTDEFGTFAAGTYDTTITGTVASN